MTESLPAKPPANASQIDIELWARELRRQWFKRAFRSALARLSWGLSEVNVAWPASITLSRRGSDSGASMASANFENTGGAQTRVNHGASK
jgi:hypothetical protein